MNLLDKLNHYFLEDPWFKPESKILLAVSGGQDSMVLFEVCLHLKLNFSVAHYCYGLRPEENKTEVQFIEKTCQINNIPLFIQHVSQKDLEDLHAGGIQEKARTLRYNWFKTLKNEYQFDYLFTAHHANDQAETILFNLSRGTGLKGLGGIKLVNGWHIRPLLQASKGELSTYAEQHNIQFCEDSSNAKLEYSRNKIRHEVLKPLQNAFPNAVANISQTAKILQETQALLDAFVDDFISTLCKKDQEALIIPAEALLNFNEAKGLLFAILNRFNFNLVQTENILTAIANKHEMAAIASSEWEVIYSRNSLYVLPQIEFTSSMDITTLNQNYHFNQQIICFQVEPKTEVTNLKDGAIYLDADKIKLPIQLRLAAPGDKFKPFGSKGSKLVSDSINQKKLSPIAKREVFVLTQSNEIIALLPLFPSQNFAVSKATQNILKITYKKS
jgi:tRNA(Ile)-lysidine synthase